MDTFFSKPAIITDIAQNILEKRYFDEGETCWADTASRITKEIPLALSDYQPLMDELIANQYFLPNSPAIANAGKPGRGLSACFVLPFEDSIEEIYQTKFNFARIARAGGGCGTTVSNLRPKGDLVRGSTHEKAAGPIAFMDTICHDMAILTQGGLRPMAIMTTMRVDHPDIREFITAKSKEGVMSNTNMSVVITEDFLRKAEEGGTIDLVFGGKVYETVEASEILDMIAEGAWRNGEPGLLFGDRINDNTPYRYSGQKIEATNPCLAADTLLFDGDKLRAISEGGDTWDSWVTGEKETIRLITSAGHEIVCTPDHPIMLEDGTFIPASEALGRDIAWSLGNSWKMAADMDEVFQITNTIFLPSKEEAERWQAEIALAGMKSRITYRKDEYIVELIDANTGLEVVRIEPAGVREVWDFRMKEGNPWNSAGGVCVHNCGEQPLSPHGMCSLGSLNLAKFVTNGTFDFELLWDAAFLGAMFLDATHDHNNFPTPETAQWSRDNRAIGLGFFGYADVLIALGMKYGSPEANQFLETVLTFMYSGALAASKRLGAEFGYPKACQNLPEPRRNVTLLTMAPTGTLSLLGGHDLFGIPQSSSSGIEPIFSDKMTRTDGTGTYQIDHPASGLPHFSCAVPTEYGVQGVTVDEHLSTLEVAASIIDSGVSKTVNAPHSFSKEDVRDLMLSLRTKYPHVKGFTFYRSGSRNEEVLSAGNEEPESKLELSVNVEVNVFHPTTKAEYKVCPECGTELEHSGCVVCPACGWGLCTS